jgi:hypothetical protein
MELGNTSISMKADQYCPAPNCPSSPQAWRSRKVVWPASSPDAEEFEFDQRLQVSQGRGRLRADTEAALARAGVELAVVAVLVVEGREFRGAQHIEPVRVALVCLVAHVEHGMAAEGDRRGALDVVGAPAPDLPRARWRRSAHRSGGSVAAGWLANHRTVDRGATVTKPLQPLASAKDHSRFKVNE